MEAGPNSADPADTPLQSTELSSVAARLETTPMAVALGWLLQRSPNILLIPGTSSVTHLRENIATVWALSHGHQQKYEG
jgi:aryl-alcohol dehydrogenase-like predicted oxidoreductase